ncbi:MAG: hypothetical protein H6705_04540 [Myxococcales bacterium]|nr:hypothetical protein [Myxococcales bacterium]
MAVGGDEGGDGGRGELDAGGGEGGGVEGEDGGGAAVEPGDVPVEGVGNRLPQLS